MRLDVARYWLSFIVPLMLAAVGTMVIVIRSSRGAWRVAAAVAGALLALGVVVPGVRFATSYPGFAPNGGDAMVELRAHLASQGGELADARVWADWGTQRVLPAYQTGPFGDPRWEAGSFRSLNRLVRFPPDLGGRVPPARGVRRDLQRRGPHLLALPARAAAGGRGVRAPARPGVGGAVHVVGREPHALPAGPVGGLADPGPPAALPPDDGRRTPADDGPAD